MQVPSMQHVAYRRKRCLPFAGQMQECETDLQRGALVLEEHSLLGGVV
jgi:hypothetical protein